MRMRSLIACWMLCAAFALVGAFPVFAAENWQPGLVQAKIVGDPSSNNSLPSKWYTNLLETIAPENLDVTAGPIMVDQHFNGTESIVNTFKDSGKSWNWDSHSTFAYEGQIYLEGSKTYWFWQQCDDGVAIRIGGTVVVSATGNSSGYNGGTSGFYTPTETGWYDLNIMAWDWTGGKGPEAGCYGIAYSTTLTEADVPKSGKLKVGTEGWNFLHDDGTGTFLRYNAYVEEVEEVEALVTTCMPSDNDVGELYFENRKLSLVKNIILTGYQKFGNINDTRTYRWSDGPLQNAGNYSKSGLYLLANDGNVLTVEFHGVNAYGSSYNGIGNGFKLQLTQVGDDIYGKVLWAAAFIQANPIFDQTWEEKASPGALNDYNSTTATYSVAGTDLKLVFRVPIDTPRTVTFVDKDGATIGTYVVPGGEVMAVAPTPPEFEGYVFHKWDKDFSVVAEDMTVKALYHRLYTVTFYGCRWNNRTEDGDGGGDVCRYGAGYDRPQI